ncbi:MAG: ECF-type sigma factor [Phycisphaerales bacterium]
MQDESETNQTLSLQSDHPDLFEALYTELRHLASMVMSDSGRAHVLQPTAIVHEAWLKLASRMSAVRDRHHFFALAAVAMRQVLIDQARARKRQKRGGGAHRITLVDELLGESSIGYDLIDFNDALDRLTALNERHAKVIEMRVFGSLTIEEIADLLGVSAITIRRDWRTAKMWMLKELCRH